MRESFLARICPFYRCTVLTSHYCHRCTPYYPYLAFVCYSCSLSCRMHIAIQDNVSCFHYTKHSISSFVVDFYIYPSLEIKQTLHILVQLPENLNKTQRHISKKSVDKNRQTFLAGALGLEPRAYGFGVRATTIVFP